MSGAALAQGLLGGVDALAGGQQLQVLAHGGVHPQPRIVGLWRQDRQVVADAGDAAVVAIGQPGQGLEGVGHLLLALGAVGLGVVEAGLGLEHVGVVGQADLVALAGLVQLAVQRLFLGAGGGQGVLGTQGAEIALGGLQDELLLGGGELQLGLLGGGLGSLELEPAIGAEQRLAEGGLDQLAAAIAAVATTLDAQRRIVLELQTGMGVVELGAEPDLRQQAGARLGHRLALGAEAGAFGGEIGVVVQRLAVDVEQAIAGDLGLGLGQAGRAAERREQQESSHSGSLP